MLLLWVVWGQSLLGLEVQTLSYSTNALIYRSVASGMMRDLDLERPSWVKESIENRRMHLRIALEVPMANSSITPNLRQAIVARDTLIQRRLWRTF